ncbi:MAG: biopolymer transporter ExbD [Jaaginema sp. PMC 1079.18]|nr:biopolymer transporter ExbD [Jaaginema sp. PMC 1080.18]MEC4851616.1 biopolymer transporter ExbD [Jaaginema sp. PMC 1079.18]MEC4868936.1 biopolymer transporter ExbD [Jaaginema sp. PMC 1078.18]
MRFRSNRTRTLPQVNLVPMLDVLMSVLTFFIISAIALTDQRLGDINIPGGGGGIAPSGEAVLTIGLNQAGEILSQNQAIDEDELTTQIQAYLAENPEGSIVLKADRDLAYTEVSQLLQTMAEIGGDRVSLAIENQD